MKEYGTSILGFIYILVGALLALAGLGGLAAGLANGQAVVGLGSLSVGLLVALVCFGIAQIFDSVAQTAHYTKEIAERLRSQPKRRASAGVVKLEPAEDPYEKWASQRRTVTPKA